jgi:hypothetical protein
MTHGLQYLTIIQNNYRIVIQNIIHSLNGSSHDQGNQMECYNPKNRVYLNFGALPLEI